MLDGKSLINLPRLLFSNFQLISRIHISLMSDECVLYLELISNNLWLASVVSLQLTHDKHVLILGQAIQ